MYTPSPDYMYAPDKVAKDPSGKSSHKGTGRSTKAPEPGLERNHQKEECLQDTIHSLEQENIKLQLENSYLTATAPRLG